MKKSLKGIMAIASSIAILGTTAVATALSASAAEDSNMTFSASKVEITLKDLAEAGNKVAITVSAEGEAGISAYNFRMAYDEKLVDAAEVEFATTSNVTNVGSRVAGVVIANFAYNGNSASMITDNELFTMTFTLPEGVAVGDRFEISFDNEDYPNFVIANTETNAVTNDNFVADNGYIEIIEEEEEETTTTTPEETTTTPEETTTTTDTSPPTGSNAPFVEMAAVVAIVGGAVAIATKKRK